MVSTKTAKKAGSIVQIIGSTFDVEYEEGHLIHCAHHLSFLIPRQA